MDWKRNAPLLLATGLICSTIVSTGAVIVYEIRDSARGLTYQVIANSMVAEQRHPAVTTEECDLESVESSVSELQGDVDKIKRTVDETHDYVSRLALANHLL